ncbi:hypothetical protein BN871_AT_00380 [Paenibacillus sp. P22]|nr:hypothetical protein BN871_AT_00380 [Paenibacillus sp. P22]
MRYSTLPFRSITPTASNTRSAAYSSAHLSRHPAWTTPPPSSMRATSDPAYISARHQAQVATTGASAGSERDIDQFRGQFDPTLGRPRFGARPILGLLRVLRNIDAISQDANDIVSVGLRIRLPVTFLRVNYESPAAVFADSDRFDLRGRPIAIYRIAKDDVIRFVRLRLRDFIARVKQRASCGHFRYASNNFASMRQLFRHLLVITAGGRLHHRYNDGSHRRLRPSDTDRDIELERSVRMVNGRQEGRELFTRARQSAHIVDSQPNRQLARYYAWRRHQKLTGGASESVGIGVTSAAGAEEGAEAPIERPRRAISNPAMTRFLTCSASSAT